MKASCILVRQSMRKTNKLLSYIPLSAVCLISGCGPVPPSSEELGQVVFKESEVPGADRPYVLPKYLQELKTNGKMTQERPPEE
jgi:hypothetical protein